MIKVLREIISLIIKEELNKSTLKNQPSIVVPVQLYLEPEPYDQLSSETVAVIDNTVYRLSKEYDAGNALVNDLVGKFSSEINKERQPFNMSRENMRAYLQGKKMELERLILDTSGVSMERLKQEARDIASEIALVLEENLYNVPVFLNNIESVEKLISDLKKTYDLR